MARRRRTRCGVFFCIYEERMIILCERSRRMLDFRQRKHAIKCVTAGRTR